MNIQIICVGNLKEKYLKMGIEEYLKRMGAYAKVTVTEVKEEHAPDKISDAQIMEIKNREADQILKRINDDVHVIALAIEGKQWSSEQLASELDRLATYGKSKVAFVIGGSFGLHPRVTQRANALLSFSPMTFPHQLMRLILVEQVYRAFKINRNEPYHK
ncbi:MAG: 23S rRNA (pseudouridine(1915)-N(3))-methyltransferase RlmH [Culicoidibacterales bacterium]